MSPLKKIKVRLVCSRCDSLLSAVLAQDTNLAWRILPSLERMLGFENSVHYAGEVTCDCGKKIIISMNMAEEIK